MLLLLLLLPRLLVLLLLHLLPLRSDLDAPDDHVVLRSPGISPTRLGADLGTVNQIRLSMRKCLNLSVLEMTFLAWRV